MNRASVFIREKLIAQNGQAFFAGIDLQATNYPKRSRLFDSPLKRGKVLNILGDFAQRRFVKCFAPAGISHFRLKVHQTTADWLQIAFTGTRPHGSQALPRGAEIRATPDRLPSIEYVSEGPFLLIGSGAAHF